MLNPVISCIVYATELLILYIFFSRIAERRFSSPICLLGGLLLFGAGSAINLLFHNDSLINACSAILIYSVFACVFFRLKWYTSIVYGLILSTLNLAMEAIIMVLLSALSGIAVTDYNQNLPFLLTTFLLCKSFWFLACLFLSSLVRCATGKSRIPLYLLYYPISMNICMLILNYICFRADLEEPMQLLYAVAIAILFLSTILLFLNYQWQLEADNEAMQLASENQRLQTEKAYYDILEQQNHQLMLYAHDARNHLAAIQSISDQPLTIDYANKLSAQLEEYTRNCHSGNMMLDVMIDRYTTACQLRHVKFSYDVKTCNLCKMENMDLVAVLGNLMDNALTSAEHSVGKDLLLETTTRNGYDVIILSNSCDTAPERNGEFLCSTKKDKSCHGYGLRSVSRTLQKYDGDLSWDYDAVKHIFITTVMIGDPVK